MNKASFTLQQWLSWMEQAHTSAIDMGLTRCQTVFDAMALDFGSTKIVTVGGTNGKGSSVAMFDAVLRAAGYRTLCYTSPHLEVYNERVVIDGEMCSDAQLVAAFCAIDAAREQVGISLSYFEIGTLAALWIVAQEQPDVALLEVGLGGRLDVVNLMDADVAVIATVGIDHVDWLGDDREIIGWEKAGIFREGRPAVCGDLEPPLSIARHANEVGAKLFQASNDFSYQLYEDGGQWSFKGLDSEHQEVTIESLPVPQLPLQNAATVMQALLLLGVEVSHEALSQGFAHARVRGRLDAQTYRGCPLLLDVAHNPQAASYLAKRLEGKQFKVVLGMLADKDCTAVMAALAPIVSQWHLVTLDVPRGQTAESLATMLPASTDQAVYQYASVGGAIKQLASDKELLLVVGSFFTVADAYRLIEGEANG